MDGILPLMKPAGWTSHDCVAKLRTLLKTKKIGHTGTLDPSVTGVLPICIGKATKIAQYVTELGKTYEGEVTLGFSTTTEDQDGEIVEKKPVGSITRSEIIEVLKGLTGNITQIPPMYSAVRVDGKHLYEYAREGIDIERPKRKVTIYELELLDDEEEFFGDTIHFSIRVKCSKGTYIRTLAVMIGEQLGYPAHMSKLIRTSAANISVEECMTLEELESIIEENKLPVQEILLPIEKVLLQLPKYEIHDKLAIRVKNGSVLPLPNELERFEDEPIAIYNQNKIIAIYKKHPSKPGLMKPARVLETEN